MAHPITSLQNKGVNCDWTSKCEDNFQKLKEMLTSALVLKIADPKGNFVECTDACKQGICGVLMQDGHVISYESWKLKEHEQNCATHVLELTTIIHILKMWRHYLKGKTFELIANHDGLKYLFE